MINYIIYIAGQPPVACERWVFLHVSLTACYSINASLIQGFHSGKLVSERCNRITICVRGCNVNWALRSLIATCLAWFSLPHTNISIRNSIALVSIRGGFRRLYLSVRFWIRPCAPGLAGHRNIELSLSLSDADQSWSPPLLCHTHIYTTT